MELAKVEQKIYKMKTNRLFPVMYNLYILLGLMILLSNCLNDNENPKDWAEEVILIVSPEKTEFYSFEGTGIPSDGILIKEENSNNGWFPFPLTGIDGIPYEEGYTYRIKVKKTNLGNPPADAFTFTYTLIQIISKETD
jgi:hypothetical protein